MCVCICGHICGPRPSLAAALGLVTRGPQGRHSADARAQCCRLPRHPLPLRLCWGSVRDWDATPQCPPGPRDTDLVLGPASVLGTVLALQCVHQLSLPVPSMPQPRAVTRLHMSNHLGRTQPACPGESRPVPSLWVMGRLRVGGHDSGGGRGRAERCGRAAAQRQGLWAPPHLHTQEEATGSLWVKNP